MKIILTKGRLKQRKGRVIFNEEIKNARFSDKRPKSRRKLYVTKTNRITFVRLPWADEVTDFTDAEITLTEREIFRLAHSARRGKSDEDLIKAIDRATSA